MWTISCSWYLQRKSYNSSAHTQCTHWHLYINVHIISFLREKNWFNFILSLEKWIIADSSCKTSKLSREKETPPDFQRQIKKVALLLPFSNNSVVLVVNVSFYLKTGLGWHIRQSCLAENIFNSNFLEAMALGCAVSLELAVWNPR